MADFVRDLAGDTDNLLLLAYIAKLNGVTDNALMVAFSEAEVDLRAELRVAERLLSISARAFGLTAEQLETLYDLAN